MDADFDWHPHWTYARDQTGQARKTTPRVGKWLIFLPDSQAYEAWPRIRRAVKEGRLGPAAKIPTPFPTTITLGEPEEDVVICVYTYDSRDEADRQRVRWVLQDLGFMPARYKTDAETLRGIRGCRQR